MGREGENNDESNRTTPKTTQTEFINRLLLHDLTNHLLVIQGNVDLITGELDESHLVDRFQTIKRQTDAAFSLLRETKSLLNGPRGEALEVVDVGSAIETELGHLETAYPEATINVEASGDVTIHAPPFFGSVVGNLIGNAIEHNDQNSPQVHVRVAVDGETVTVEVEDNGPGISETILNNLTKLAVRDDDGMGLYIVHSLVDQYDGTLSIESDSGGTSITVNLPVTSSGDDSTLSTRISDTREPISIQQPLGEDDSPCMVVIRAIASASDRRMEDLDPLGQTIDTDALESLLQKAGGVHVEFQYEGYTVSVDSEEIRVEALESV